VKNNPVWSESIEVFYGEGHGFAAYFYLLTILAPIEFLSLYLPSLDAQMWSGSASLFRVSSATALLLTTYFSLRVANQEFAPWRFLPIRRWVDDRALSPGSIARAQLAFLSLHAALSIALCAPLLVWAGAIARTPLPRIGVTLLLLLFYAFSYGVWGLVTLVLWERRAETRQVFIRGFFFTLVFLSALVYLPLNPVAFLLAYLGRQQLPPLQIAALKLPATGVQFGFHLLLAAAGLTAYRWGLRKGTAP
jgi:hypothetical protein